MAFPASQLSQENILRDVHDTVNQRLRTDTTVTAIIENVTVNVSDIIIRDATNSSYKLEVESDGSINANVVVSHTDDSIRLGDGVNLITSTTSGPKQGLDVNVINAIDVNVNHTSDSVAIGDGTNLYQVATDGVTSPTRGMVALGTDGTNARILKTDSSGELQIDVLSSALPTGAATSALQTTGNTSLSSIDSKLNTLGQKTMAGSVPVVLPSDQNITLAEPVKISGSEDGASGTEYGFVYNQKQQILDSHDRLATFTYADFGTKNERITRIDYTSPTFPGITARVDYTYTLVTGNYRRDNETWTIV